MSRVLANTITPLMALGCWQLLFGNALIGLVEAKLIARFLGANRRAPIWTMIGANYVSMFAAMVFMPGPAQLLAAVPIGEVPLYHVRSLIAAIILLNLILSILCEWPFVYAAFRNEQRRVRRSLVACCAAQAASYLLLLIPCWLASSVLSGVEIAPVDQISRNKDAAVLFIGNDGDMYRVTLDGNAPVKYRSLAGKNPDAVLVAGRNDDGRTGLWLSQNQGLELIDAPPDLMSQVAGTRTTG